MIDACSWDDPGKNPFMGDVVAAVARYDLPPATIKALQAKVAARAYDDMALITRDTIEGRAKYTNLRQMHFGRGQVCGAVSRAKWSDAMRERGLVFCAEGACVIVPTVCRNVSLVDLVPKPKPQAATPVELDSPAPGGGAVLLADIPFTVLPQEPVLPPLVAEAPPVWQPAWPPLPVSHPPIVWQLPPPIVLPPRPPVPAVPEPGTWALLLSGLAICVWRARQLRQGAVE